MKDLECDIEVVTKPISCGYGDNAGCTVFEFLNHGFEIMIYHDITRYNIGKY